MIQSESVGFALLDNTRQQMLPDQEMTSTTGKGETYSSDTRKVSIMIPTFNQEEYIERCVRSALNQDYRNLEVVVSDDKSTDGTFDLLKSSVIDSRLRLYRNTRNLGRVGNYRRLLYELANGEFVLMLDGDDWLICDSYISAAIKQLDNSDSAVCALAAVNLYNEEKGKIVISRISLSRQWETIDGNKMLVNLPRTPFPFNHQTLLYDRKAACSIGFYRKNIISSDSESFYRLIANNKFLYLKQVVAVWRQHSANDSATATMDLAYENQLEKIDSVFEYIRGVSVFGEIDAEKWKSDMEIQAASGIFIDGIKRLKYSSAVEAIRFLSNMEAGRIVRACILVFSRAMCLVKYKIEVNCRRSG